MPPLFDAHTADRLVTDARPYPRDAYVFVAESVIETLRLIAGENGAQTHVSAVEIIRGCARDAVARFSVLASDVLKTWHINASEDIGQIVFAMIDIGFFRAGPHDAIENFVHAPSLHELIGEKNDTLSYKRDIGAGPPTLPFID